MKEQEELEVHKYVKTKQIAFKQGHESGLQISLKVAKYKFIKEVFAAVSKRQGEAIPQRPPKAQSCHRPLHSKGCTQRRRCQGWHRPLGQEPLRTHR